MSDYKNPAEGSRSLPDDIAASAGLPNGPKSEHSLHQVQDRPGGAARPGLSSAEARSSEVSGSARGAAQEAADRIDEAKARAADLAGSAQDRVRNATRDARERAAGTYSDARSWVSDQHEEQRRRVSDLADRSTERFQDGRTAVERFVSDNPLLVGVVGLAAGLLLGALLPRTRQEDRTVGPWADELRDQGVQYARDMTNRGREFVESALDPSKLDAAAQQAGTAPSKTSPEPRPTAQPS